MRDTRARSELASAAARHKYLTNGVLLGRELQRTLGERAVQEEVVDAARRRLLALARSWSLGGDVPEGQALDAVGSEAAVAGVQDVAEGALEQEHHRACEQQRQQKNSLSAVVVPMGKSARWGI